MSEQQAGTPSTEPGEPGPDVTGERSRAFVALALALVGVMGGGLIGTGVVRVASALSGSLFEGDIGALLVIAAVVPAGFALASLWLVSGIRSSDPVAVPASRAVQVLAVVTLVGGVLAVLAAVLEGF